MYNSKSARWSKAERKESPFKDRQLPGPGKYETYGNTGTRV